ncbi:MAG: hypothetical protein ACPG49_10350 [Chitinophagales bacterium]
MNLLDKYFDAEGGLTLEGVAIYAEAIKLNKVEKLPNSFQEYLLKNPMAAQEVLEIYELIADEELDDKYFPFDKVAISDYKVPSTNEDLDVFLAGILQKALAEESTPNARLERRMLQTVKARGTKLKVLTPEENEICVDKIHFSFNLPVGEETYITIFNEKDDEIAEYELDVETKSFNILLNEEEYPSGLYYWMLDKDRDVRTKRFYVCQPKDAKRILKGIGEE